MSLVCIESIFTDFSPYKNVLLTQNNFTEFISKKQFKLLFHIFIYQRFSKMHGKLFNFSLYFIFWDILWVIISSYNIVDLILYFVNSFK